MSSAVSNVAAALLVAIGATVAPAQQPAPPTAPAPRPPSADAVVEIKTLCTQRRFGEAARRAQQAVKQWKDDPNAWMALAAVHLTPDWALRQPAIAEKAAEHAIRLAGRRPELVAMLSTADFFQGKYDEELALVAELVDATPPKVSGDTLAELLVQRADTRVRTQVDDVNAKKEALADLERALAVQPALASARVARADLLLADGKNREALADLEVAVAAAPGSKQVHHLMHQCLWRLDRKDEARRHSEIWRLVNELTDSTAESNAPTPEERRDILRQLAELNPADLDRRLELAQVELELGAPDAAIAVCDVLLGVKPNWPAALYVKGEAQKAKKGDAKPPAPKRDGEGGGGK